MNFFQRLEDQILKAYHSFLTPAVTSVIEGQIASVNLDPVHADKSGDEKHFLVAAFVADFFKIAETVAHSLVKIVFDRLEAKEPAILQPITEQIEQAAQGVVSDVAAQASVSMTASPFTQAATIQSPKGTLAAVLSMPTNLTPQAP
jgi:hypothetical protein